MKKKTKTKRGGIKSHNTRVALSSKKHDWRSSRKLLRLVEKVAGKIQFDPCADVNEKYHFAVLSISAGGLEDDWVGHGVTYANPPYGRALVHWIRKAIAEAKKRRPGDHIFLLTPSRTDTKWFQELLLQNMTAMCFWKGRLTFSGEPDPAPFPSLVTYFGPKPKKFTKVFKKYGWIVRRAA